MDKTKGRRDGGTKGRRERGPGVVRGKGHGPPGPVEALYGTAHLRQVLNLSAEVHIERVCQDAAVELEDLRKEPSAPWPT